MKRFHLVLLLGICFPALFSCKNIASKQETAVEEVAYITLSATSPERTIAPVYETFALNDIVLTGQKTTEAEITELASFENYATMENASVAVVTGDWYAFTLSAYEENTLLQATLYDVTITEGENTLLFALAVQDDALTDGFGSLSVSFSFPAQSEVRYAKIGLYERESDEYVLEPEFSLLSVSANENDVKAAYTMNDIPSGMYRLRAWIYADSDCTLCLSTWQELVIVIAGSTSRAERTISNLNTIYTVTFDLAGASFVDEYTPRSQYTRYDALISLPSAEQMQKEGYVFGGWYDGETQVRNGSYMVTKNVTLTARWILDGVWYTLSYQTAYGTAPESLSIEAGSLLSDDNLPELSTDGLLLAFWYDNNGQRVDAGYIVSDDLVLTARWTAYGTLYVNASGNDSSGLGTEAAPYATLTQALEAINWNPEALDCTIMVSGTLTGTTEIGEVNAMSLLICGLHENSGTDYTDVLDGNGQGTVLHISCSVPVTIRNIKITGGETDNFGGGILIKSIETTSLTIEEGAFITGNTAICGGGIYGGCSLTMTGGEISNNQAVKDASGDGGNGGGVQTWSAGTFVMTGGKICGNNAEGSGGGIFNGGVFLQSGGVISGNTASSDGGGVYSSTHHLFTMSGGIISNNKANLGGGVSNSNEFTLAGGIITGNTAMRGGGLYTRATANISDGLISDNTAEYGGGINIATNGTVIMKDGTIDSNVATNSGGGVTVDGGSFTMSGGTITGNSAILKGAGVYAERGSFTMTDSAKISSSDYVYLNGNNVLTIAGNLTENAPVAVIDATSGTVLAEAEEGLLASNYSKFAPKDTEYRIDANGIVYSAGLIAITDISLSSVQDGSIWIFSADNRGSAYRWFVDGVRQDESLDTFEWNTASLRRGVYEIIVETQIQDNWYSASTKVSVGGAQ